MTLDISDSPAKNAKATAEIGENGVDNQKDILNQLS